MLDVYHGPIANAIIMVDGQKTNSVTDARGNYRIKVKPGATRIGVFTFGNGTSENYIDGRTRIDFNLSTMRSEQLHPNARERERGINTGYGKVKEKPTTEVTNIDGADKKYSTYSSVYDMIQRHVSGVRVSGKDIIIQGSSDFHGFVRPLVVLDGVYMTRVPDIPPSTVRSIEVLKSTAASPFTEAVRWAGEVSMNRRNFGPIRIPLYFWHLQSIAIHQAASTISWKGYRA